MDKVKKLARDVEKARVELNRAIQIAEHNGLDVIASVRSVTATRGRLPCQEISIIIVKEIETN